MPKANNPRFFLFLTFFLILCASAVFADEPSAKKLSFSQTLDEARQARDEKLGAARVAILEKGLQQLKEQKLADQAINIGETAPNFELKATDDRLVSLSGLLEKGPVIVIWYRGGNSAFSDVQLKAFQALASNLESLSASIVAIGLETKEMALETVQRNTLSFPVLSDPGGEAAKRFRLTCPLKGEVRANLPSKEKFRKFFGVPKKEFILPAVYIVDTDWVIRYANISEDDSRLADPRDVQVTLSLITAKPVPGDAVQAAPSAAK